MSGSAMVNQQGPEVSDDDIFQAMREIKGYLDITPGDFKELYLKAIQHARRRMMGTRRAREVMTVDVVAVGLETPLPEVARIMAARGVSGVPALGPDREVSGVISEKDFLRHMQDGRSGGLMALVAGCLGTQACLVSHLLGKAARDIMSSPAICVGPEDSVDKIALLFTAQGINRAPVVDDQGRLLGIVTRSDLLRQAGRERAS